LFAVGVLTRQVGPPLRLIGIVFRSQHNLQGAFAGKEANQFPGPVGFFTGGGNGIRPTGQPADGFAAGIQLGLRHGWRGGGGIQVTPVTGEGGHNPYPVNFHGHFAHDKRIESIPLKSVLERGHIFDTAEAVIYGGHIFQCPDIFRMIQGNGFTPVSHKFRSVLPAVHIQIGVAEVGNKTDVFPIPLLVILGHGFGHIGEFFPVAGRPGLALVIHETVAHQNVFVVQQHPVVSIVGNSVDTAVAGQRIGIDGLIPAARIKVFFAHRFNRRQTFGTFGTGIFFHSSRPGRQTSAVCPV